MGIKKRKSKSNEASSIAESCMETVQGMHTTNPILRLREFVFWAKQQGLCKSEYDFECQCKLSRKYITNNIHSGKGNIGTEILGRIISVFPQLNLSWLCTGKGTMLLSESSDITADYKQAYEGAMMQIEALTRIIQSKNE